MPNYATKPRLSLVTSKSQSSSAPPPYAGDGNGFYGVDEKAAVKNSSSTQERTVAAWQVHLNFNLINVVFQITTILRSYLKRLRNGCSVGK
jgi:hypothetical protein